MDITLIRPPSITSQNAVGQDAAPPLGLAYLAGSLESAGHNVCLVDAIGESIETYISIGGFDNALRHGLEDQDIIDKIPNDVQLIGITCMFSLEWTFTRTLIQAIRERFPNVTIVAGGEHITACAEYVMKDCSEIDVCGIGEGEETIVALANALERAQPLQEVQGIIFRENDQLLHTEPRSRIKGIGDIPRPAWHLVPIENYINNGVMTGVDIGPSIPIMASRGCPYRCTFCSSPQMWTTRWEARPVEDVLAEMIFDLEKYGATNFDFYDLTAIVKRDWIVQMAKLIIESGLKITWQLPSGTRSEALDDEVTRLMYESGCRHVNYAPESGSDFVLKMIKKRVNKDDMIRSMRAAVKNGLVIKANFILGFPKERPRHLLETFYFIIQLAWVGIHEAHVFPVTPYPGSELFEDLVREKKITLNDKYFVSLAQYTDPGVTQSYSEYYSDRILGALCLLGMVLFFSISFLLNPRRFCSLVKNLYKGNPQTKLETSLNRVYKKMQRRI